MLKQLKTLLKQADKEYTRYWKTGRVRIIGMSFATTFAFCHYFYCHITKPLYNLLELTLQMMDKNLIISILYDIQN